MSEEEVQSKESIGDQEILKKKDIVEDGKNEKEESKEVEGEKPTNGIHSSSEEESKPKEDESEEKDEETEEEEKEESLENSKEDESTKEDEEEDSKEVSKTEDSKADKSEAMDESVEDSINDSKNETNEDEEEEDESMDVSKDESVDETPKKGILEQPVEIKGKRERKKVERFVQETKKEEVEVEGRGTALKEIPFIQNMILKTGPDDLKHLHRLAYNRPGTAPEIRKNLYKFKGFPFIKDDKAYERKKASAEKIVISELKKILNILGLERSGVKSVLVERLMAFLLEPYDAGKRVAQAKRRKSSQGKKRSSNKKKKEKGTKESQSSESGSEDDEEKSEEGEEEEEEKPEEEEEEQEESEKEDESDEEPVVIKKPAKKKAAPAKATPKRTPQPKKTPKGKAARTPRTQQKKRPKESESEADSDDSKSSEEQQPKSKKAKKSPTDTEIETFIKKLLEKADLNEVTMKKLCQQVYDNYPGQDLSHKKDFIKSTVKSILS